MTSKKEISKILRKEYSYLKVPNYIAFLR